MTDLNGIEQQFGEFCNTMRLSQELSGRLLHMLKIFAGNETIIELFSQEMKHLNETTIIDGNKTYRPDKIVFNDQKTLVIDFKTGQQHSSHHEQIRTYAELLKSMNFKNISTILVYVSEDSIEIQNV
jgi:predicted Ser/Thr protein kinase